MKKITKAVIPAAGLGTRMLPIARTVPKEMLPIVDRPAISYLVEEAADSGITDILIITNREKDAIEAYFDYSPEYEAQLMAKGKGAQVEELRRLNDRVNVFFLRQKEARGLGHAVLRARSFTGDEPFAVLYGDDVIFSHNNRPVIGQLIDAYEKYGRPVAGAKSVSTEWVMKYCSLDATLIEGNEYRVRKMIEKPKKEEIITNLAILGRVVLTPEIYDILERIPYGAGNELQLTDAMNVIAASDPEGGFTAIDFIGKRYDMGSKLGFLEANIERAAVNPELGADFVTYLKEFVKAL